jgi:hypothetical protein
MGVFGIEGWDPYGGSLGILKGDPKGVSLRGLRGNSGGQLSLERSNNNNNDKRFSGFFESIVSRSIPVFSISKREPETQSQ